MFVYFILWAKLFHCYISCINCRNKFNSGRPKDALERCTRKPRASDLIDTSLLDNDDNKDEHDYNLELEDELFNTYFENMDVTEEQDVEDIFCDSKKILKIDTSTIRLKGVNKCGQENVTIPDCTKILEKNLVKNAIIASDRNIADDAIDANEKNNE